MKATISSSVVSFNTSTQIVDKKSFDAEIYIIYLKKKLEGRVVRKLISKNLKTTRYVICVSCQIQLRNGPQE